jgi:hypothetical protein
VTQRSVAERHGVGRQVLKTTDAMTRIMELKNPVTASIRNRLASALSWLEIFQRLVRRNMSEISVNYRQSPIVAEYHENLFDTIAAFGGGPRAGDRAPDANGRFLPDGATGRLFDLLRGDNHNLFPSGIARSDSRDAANILSTARQVNERYGQNVMIYTTSIIYPDTRDVAWR